MINMGDDGKIPDMVKWCAHARDLAADLRKGKGVSCKSGQISAESSIFRGMEHYVPFAKRQKTIKAMPKAGNAPLRVIAALSNLQLSKHKLMSRIMPQ